MYTQCPMLVNGTFYIIRYAEVATIPHLHLVNFLADFCVLGFGSSFRFSFSCAIYWRGSKLKALTLSSAWQLFCFPPKIIVSVLP